MTIEVINIKQGIPKDKPYVYIGRKMPGRPGSPVANPFKASKESDRPKVLQQYVSWLREQMESNTPARREIERIAVMAKSGDVMLLCWCTPKSCHGDVIKEIVMDIVEANKESACL